MTYVFLFKLAKIFLESFMLLVWENIKLFLQFRFGECIIRVKWYISHFSCDFVTFEPIQQSFQQFCGSKTRFLLKMLKKLL